MTPRASVTSTGHILIENPPGALGYVKRTPITLVYVTHEYDGSRRERRIRTVGKSIASTPDAIAFKVAPSEAGREAVEMVREGLVDPVAVGAELIIELSPDSRPTVELVTHAEAARRRDVATRSAMSEWRIS